MHEVGLGSQTLSDCDRNEAYEQGLRVPRIAASNGSSASHTAHDHPFGPMPTAKQAQGKPKHKACGQIEPTN